MPSRDTRTSRERQQVGSAKVPDHTTARSSRVSSTENVAGPSRPVRATLRKPPSPAKPNAVFKAPNDPIPIVDFRTETSPNRMTADKKIERSEESSIKAKRGPRRSRASSSIPAESIDGDTKKTSSGASKPASVISKISHSTHRSQTPASESNYDNASIADTAADSNSISTGRIRRTEAQRKQYFENEPDCGSIEAHRALCTRCKKWVRLSGKQTYSTKSWETHRTRCDQKLPAQPTYKDLGLVASLPFAVPRTEKVCKALLELDDDAEIVELHQIKCKTCQQWVPLEKKYELKDWTAHKSACHKNLNSEEIEKALERKLFFLCDAQFKRFQDPHTVECGACNQRIALKSDMDYDLEKWLAHRKRCQTQPANHRTSIAFKSSSSPLLETGTQPQADTSIPSGENPTPNDQTSSQPQTQPTGVPHDESNPKYTSTTSTNDSEHTLVPASSPALPTSASTFLALASASRSSSPASVSTPELQGSLKRKHDLFQDGTPSAEAEEGTSVDGERPVRRPRTESYVPEDEDPNMLGLFLLPFKAFVQGFKESLTTLES